MKSANWISHIPNIETSRLTLRQIQRADAADIFKLYSDIEVLQYTDNKLHATIEDSNFFIHNIEIKFSEKIMVCWGISIKKTPEIIGTIRLYHPDFYHRFISIGNLLSKTHWNKGFMTEAQESISHFAFEKMNMHRVEAQIFVGNVASIKTFEKIGYQYEGKLRQNFLINGNLENSLLYSLLNTP